MIENYIINPPVTTNSQDIDREFNRLYPTVPRDIKIKLKAWKYHSLTRLQANKEPFKFDTYSKYISEEILNEYIENGVIDISDL
jgi:hypothetical protein